jgi:hypothetical protein
MFRPSRGHLQADVCDILGSIWIVWKGLQVFVIGLEFTYDLILRLKLDVKITGFIFIFNYM